jgi:hypothetical protein
VSLEIICKPSIKLSPKSGSIYMPKDQAPAPLPDSGAAISELKGIAGQRSAAGLAKDSGAVVSKLAPTAGQLDKAGMLTDPGVDGFRVARTWGTTRRTQRFERRGLNVGDLGSQRNMMMEASSCQMHNVLQRETPSFTQVQGPHGEVNPLLPAFLYYNAIPREEYKVLVTEF